LDLASELECDFQAYRREKEMENFFFVYAEGGNNPARKHPTRDSAETEAERIASLPEMAGKKIHVLETTGYFQAEICRPQFHSVSRARRR
jgi:hypothetical protein